MESKGDMDRWDKRFDKCFGAAGKNVDSGRRSIGQKVSNLINLGF
jgi:hypothetical protein